MKSVGLFISIILLIAAPVRGQNLPEGQTAQPSQEKSNTLNICAGDVPPENMVITATGTSVTCVGSCRGRQIEPVEGPVMVICAGQPVPQYYEAESVTSSPACNCIGDEDNAYVIRRLNGAPTPTPNVTFPGAQIPVPNPPSNNNPQSGPPRLR
jgi:hypothetical protein